MENNIRTNNLSSNLLKNYKSDKPRVKNAFLVASSNIIRSKRIRNSDIFSTTTFKTF